MGFKDMIRSAATTAARQEAIAETYAHHNPVADTVESDNQLRAQAAAASGQPRMRQRPMMRRSFGGGGGPDGSSRHET